MAVYRNSRHGHGRHGEYERDPEAYRKRSATRAKANGYASQLRWRENNPEKFAVQQTVARALRRGDISREPCLFCGEDRVEAHHHDYAKPLDITWLCRKHHRSVHRQVLP